MTGAADRREEILAFIRDDLCRGEPPVPIEDDSLLVEDGVIDSFGIVELTIFLKSRYAVDISDEDMRLENFGSLRRIVEFVGRKTVGVRE